MTRSAYATTSSLPAPCPACRAAIGRQSQKAVMAEGRRIGCTLLKHCHSARVKAAADKRTAEVHPGLTQGGGKMIHGLVKGNLLSLPDTFEIPPDVPLPSTRPEPRTLAHHKVRS